MRIIAVRCDQCGAPLDVPADREQLTCGYCGSGLHVSRLRSALPIDAAAAPSSQLSEREQTLNAELEKLDDEWEAYRATYLPKDGSGEYFVPDPEVYRLGMWVTGVLGAVVGVAAVVSGAAWVLVPLVIVVICLLAHLLHQMKVGEVYARSIENYRHNRLTIVRQLEDAGNS